MKLSKHYIFIALLGLLITSCQPNKQQASDTFFTQIKSEKIASDQSVEWKNFGPGMAGYNEEFWCHPTDTNTMFMGPDMHVSFGTWDNGKSWHNIKDCDGLGQEMKRVLDVEFSRQDPDYGMAIDWNGWAYTTTDRGRNWIKIKELGRSYNDLGIDPDGENSFGEGWYYEQLGTRLSELSVDPTNDNIWYVGAGDFWNVKGNHKSAKNAHGIQFKFADYGYIWKTTDKGKTWNKINNGLPENLDVAKIIIDPKNTKNLIMAANVGVLHSYDGGISWKSVVKGLPNNLPRDLTSYTNKETGEFVLYLVEQSVYQEKGKSVQSKGGVFVSVDGGVNWKSITGNLALDLNKITYPTDIDRYYKTIAYWFGLDKSDAKKKYTKLPQRILPVYNRIVVNPLDKNEIYVTLNKKHDRTFGPGEVWKTQNGGKSWMQCARHGAYWKSEKDAKYWKSKDTPLETNIEFAHLQDYMDSRMETSGNRTLEINAVGQLFIGIDQQTLRSNDKGETWQQVDDFETSPGSNKWIGRGGSDLPGRFLLLETGIKDRALICSGEHGLWQTTDLEEWPDKQAIAVEQIEGQVHDGEGRHSAHSISTVAVHPNDPNTIYILAWRQEHRGKLRRTTDGGKSWENIATIFEADSPEYRGLAAQNSLVIDPINPKNMYFCATLERISEISIGKSPAITKGEYGFCKSSDGGYTWEHSNKGFHDGFSIRRIVLDPGNPDIIYAASNDDNGGLYKSIDKGTNWNKVEIPSVIRAVNNVFVDRNNKHIYISAGMRNGTYNEGGVWYSKDNGISWENIFKAPYVWQCETSPVNPDLIVISVAGQEVDKENPFMNPGIYLSSTAGKSWIKVNKGLGQPDKIVDVKPDPYNEHVLWCASWGCGWYKATIK